MLRELLLKTAIINNHEDEHDNYKNSYANDINNII